MWRMPCSMARMAIHLKIHINVICAMVRIPCAMARMAIFFVKYKYKLHLRYGADAMFYDADGNFDFQIIIKVPFVLWRGCHVLWHGWQFPL